ncbi:Uncharacterised protein [Achromobacter xylosoxidans]|nr:Uncharacterised protein [Achromobacter xylosoxidans]
MRRAERARIRIPQQAVVAQVPHVLLQHVQVIALGAHPLVDLQHVRIQRRHRRAHRRGRRGRRHRAIAADLAHRIGRRARLAVRAHPRPAAQRRGQRLARIPVRLVRRRLHCLIDPSGHRLAITNTGEFRVGRIGLALRVGGRGTRCIGDRFGIRGRRLGRRRCLLCAGGGTLRRVRRPLRARRGLLRVRCRLPHAVKLSLVHRIRRRNARRHVRNPVLRAVRVGRAIGLLRRIPHQGVALDLVDAVHHLLVGAQALQLPAGLCRQALCLHGNLEHILQCAIRRLYRRIKRPHRAEQGGRLRHASSKAAKVNLRHHDTALSVHFGAATDGLRHRIGGRGLAGACRRHVGGVPVHRCLKRLVDLPQFIDGVVGGKQLSAVDRVETGRADFPRRHIDDLAGQRLVLLVAPHAHHPLEIGAVERIGLAIENNRRRGPGGAGGCAAAQRHGQSLGGLGARTDRNAVHATRDGAYARGECIGPRRFGLGAEGHRAIRRGLCLRAQCNRTVLVRDAICPECDRVDARGLRTVADGHCE